MEAILSPQRNAGLILDQGQPHAFITPENIELVRLGQGFVARWMREVKDAVFLEDVTTEEAQERLRHEAAQELAFRLLLPLFDLSQSDDLRLEVALKIERICSQDKYLFDWLGARFYAAPFPDPSRLENAIELTRAVAVNGLRRFLLKLYQLQPLIYEVWQAWRQIPESYFLDTEAADDLRKQFLEDGVFYQLVDVLAADGPLSSFIRNENARLAHKGVSGLDDLLHDLTQPFHDRRQEQKLSPEKFSEYRSDINDWKNQILGFVRLNDLDRVTAETEKLVALQLKHGPPLYAAISLSELAVCAKEIGHTKAQRIFTQLAVKVHPWNVRIWTQFADLHKCEGVPMRALELYDDVLCQHPNHVAARNGRAEALRDLGRLEDALAAYDQSILKHRESVVARCGRAEVLRDLGRLEDALAAYDQIILKHRESVVAKCGRAEVLRDLGRLEDALAAYDQIILKHRESVVAKCGRAEVLRDLGQPEDALAAYDQTILEHRESVVAKNGRAGALRDLGRLEDALAAYDQIILEHRESVPARNGRAGVLARLGRFTEALLPLPLSPPRSKQDFINFHVRGMVLLQMGQVNEAHAIFKIGVAQAPTQGSQGYFQTAYALCCLLSNRPGDVLKTGIKATSKRLQDAHSVIRSHALGMLGEEEECKDTLTPLLLLPSKKIRDLAAEIDARYLQRIPRFPEPWLFEGEKELLSAI